MPMPGIFKVTSALATSAIPTVVHLPLVCLPDETHHVRHVGQVGEIKVDVTR